MAVGVVVCREALGKPDDFFNAQHVAQLFLDPFFGEAVCLAPVGVQQTFRCSNERPAGTLATSKQVTRFHTCESVSGVTELLDPDVCFALGS